MNNKLIALVIGGMLILAACGEETQPTKDESVEETAVMPEENVGQEQVEKDKENEKEPEEEEAEAEEPVEENTTAVDAASGEASPLLSKGDMTSFVFNETGEFSIYCEPHPVMKMTVIVEEGASNSGELTLDIASYEFSEDSITVAPGTIITWTNQDSAQHNVAFE
ncbi:plastocyanin/azurin family copper-binding protein [Paenisporosarcina sp. TG20]|uniref:plastocyanin/azurin family copper-binding protein n=1 Tax=Paenisporosarcina sp. TG20 TaxID=1211706 RepID=UPI0002E00F65|nr:plastocyanin/azurin family copper-binding protein [Paenisporosarcina sp. TG20]